MGTRGRLVVAGCLGLAGVLLLVGAFVRTENPRNYLRGRYGQTSVTGSSVVLSSPLAPRAVYNDLVGRARPADTVADAGGYYLRYRNDIVAITGGPGGSRIYVDDERQGYNRWYGHVGGFWGTFGGPGEAFRGGGPGSGK